MFQNCSNLIGVATSKPEGIPNFLSSYTFCGTQITNDGTWSEYAFDCPSR